MLKNSIADEDQLRGPAVSLDSQRKNRYQKTISMWSRLWFNRHQFTFCK